MINLKELHLSSIVCCQIEGVREASPFHEESNKCSHWPFDGWKTRLYAGRKKCLLRDLALLCLRLPMVMVKSALRCGYGALGHMASEVHQIIQNVKTIHSLSPSVSLPLLLILSFLGSSPNRGGSPVEWREITYVRPSIYLSVCMSVRLYNCTLVHLPPGRPSGSSCRPSGSSGRPLGLSALWSKSVITLT